MSRIIREFSRGDFLCSGLLPATFTRKCRYVYLPDATGLPIIVFTPMSSRHHKIMDNQPLAFLLALSQALTQGSIGSNLINKKYLHMRWMEINLVLIAYVDNLRIWPNETIFPTNVTSQTSDDAENNLTFDRGEPLHSSAIVTKRRQRKCLSSRNEGIGHT